MEEKGREGKDLIRYHILVVVGIQVPLNQCGLHNLFGGTYY